MFATSARFALAATALGAVLSVVAPQAAHAGIAPPPGSSTTPQLPGPGDIVNMHFCNGKIATIVGTSGIDSIQGTPSDDVIVSLGGNDWVYGNGGNDTICSGLGDDHVFGEDLTPSLNDGLNTVYGGPGADYIIGGGGKDVVSGGTGSDYILGSDGADTLSGDDDNDTIYGQAGIDYADGGAGSDLLDAASGDDGSYDMVYGGADNDVLRTKDGIANDVGDGGTGVNGCRKDLGEAVSNCQVAL